MSEGNSLDRPATDEEIAMVERLLRRSATSGPRKNVAKVVPLPKARPVPKATSEVLALPVMPLLSPIRRPGDVDDNVGLPRVEPPAAVELEGAVVSVCRSASSGSGPPIGDLQDRTTRLTDRANRPIATE